jgi:hypothetical protein
VLRDSRSKQDEFDGQTSQAGRLDEGTCSRSQGALEEQDVRGQNLESDEAHPWRYPPEGIELGTSHGPSSIAHASLTQDAISLSTPSVHMLPSRAVWPREAASRLRVQTNREVAPINLHSRR